jgi:hypothetical protein
MELNRTCLVRRWIFGERCKYSPQNFQSLPDDMTGHPERSENLRNLSVESKSSAALDLWRTNEALSAIRKIGFYLDHNMVSVV